LLLPLSLLLSAVGVVLILCGRGRRMKRRKPWIDAHTAARTGHSDAVAALTDANTFPRQVGARSAIARASSSWDALPRVRTEKYRQLQANKRQAQLQQFLRSHLVEAATIKGIGKGRLATLSAYGIDTAWDLVPARITQVPQIGAVLADRLISWRRSVERRFVYDASQPVPPEATTRLDSEMKDAQRVIVEDLKRALRQLEDARVTENAAAAEAAGRLREASITLLQAESDVRAATGKAPT
jgi:DNA-binding helix-hairpin-helix protein with protein kinase domain